jgi:hypothetical protein
MATAGGVVPPKPASLVPPKDMARQPIPVAGNSLSFSRRAACCLAPASTSLARSAEPLRGCHPVSPCGYQASQSRRSKRLALAPCSQILSNSSAGANGQRLDLSSMPFPHDLRHLVFRKLECLVWVVRCNQYARRNRSLNQCGAGLEGSEPRV